ncbi:MAG: cell cycle transcriptional regulator TrcR [Pseudomonadota bacterium]|nr:cell cycle transcriptional regulator TrcR [Pseudomonadota bacterium]
MALPLMPKATAVWLVDNTTLTFQQIAEFCGLHPLEIQGIADGEVAQNIVGMDPIGNNQLTRSEIERCQKDTLARLQLRETAIPMPKRSTRGARYTPVSKRQDRPAAIAWLLRHHPELTDAQVQKLLGTTKDTISKIRERTHWNIQNIKPTDPVSLGICTQTELAEAVTLASERRRKEIARTGVEPEAPAAPQPEPARARSTYDALAAAALGMRRGRGDDQSDEPTIDSVFGKRD